MRAQLIYITTQSGEGATGGTGLDGVRRDGWSSVTQVPELATLLLARRPGDRRARTRRRACSSAPIPAQVRHGACSSSRTPSAANSSQKSTRA